MTNGMELAERGEMIVSLMMSAIEDAQVNAPRTLQSTARTLGLSEIGGCREYLRATIAGLPKDPEKLKWAAFVGTAVGDYVEEVLKDQTGATTQETVTVRLLDGKISGTGHLDVRWSSTDDLVDLKTKAELDTVRREGPPFKHQAQLACYFKALVDASTMTRDGFAHLVYLDRSGRDDEPYVWTINWERAELIILALEERLMDVANALARGDDHAPRDEPESYCYAIGCPFYSRCWDGYTPTGLIDHPEEIRKLEEFDEARAQVKAWTNTRDTKRLELAGVDGVTADGWISRWSTMMTARGEVPKYELRLPKEKGGSEAV